MLRQLLKLTFVFALLLTGLNLSAQKNVVFELDGGYSMIGDNSQTGFGLNADLGYTFWGRLTPTVGYQFHTFANQRNHYDTNANIDLAYLAVKVTALKFKWFSLDLGPLAFRRMWKQEYKVHDGYTVYKDGLTMDGKQYLFLLQASMGLWWCCRCKIRSIQEIRCQAGCYLSDRYRP